MWRTTHAAKAAGWAWTPDNHIDLWSLTADTNAGKAEGAVMRFSDRGDSAGHRTFRPEAPVARSEWIALTPPEETSSIGTWSPDSRRLYYFSDRDGQVCVWSRAVDPATGHPAGDPVAVWHLHEARHSAGRIGLPLRGLAVARDRIVISLAESTATIWLSTSTQAEGRR
jgi:hypothetical protein